MALQRLVCNSCDAKIPSRPFCPRCGQPTKLATSQQRILWEMGQWEDHRTKVVPEKPARLTLGQPQRAVARSTAPATGDRNRGYAARLVQGSSAMAIPMEQLDLRAAPPPAPAAPTRQTPVRPDPHQGTPAGQEPSRETPPPRPSETRSSRVGTRPPVPPADELRRATPARPSPPRRVAPSPSSAPPAPSPAQPNRRVPVPPRRPEPTADTVETVTAPSAEPPRAQAPVVAASPAAAPAAAPPAAAPPAPPAAADAPMLADGRTLVIKRRAHAPIEPTPDPFETASTLREISEKSEQGPSRRERRRARHDELRRAADARAQAERARKEAEKLAKKQAKLARKNKEEAERIEVPDPDSIEVPDGPSRIGWKERKALKMLDAIGAVDGEEIALMHDGRSRLRSATLVVTTYRVAVVSRGARRRVIGWIPLEEIERIKRVWRGAETLHIEGSFERLSFQAAASGALAEALSLLRVAVKEARAPGTVRHNADVIQAWCERTAEVWENGANRVRLWIRKHPAATLAGLGSLVPAAYLLSSRL